MESESASDENYTRTRVPNDGFVGFLESVYYLIPIPAIIICILGIIGNILNGLVLSRKEMKSPSSVVLLGLTFFDLSLLFSLLIWYSLHFTRDIDHMLRFSIEPLPYFVVFPLMRAAYTGSVYTTLLITVERYVVISWPLHAGNMVTLRRATLGVAAVLIWALVANSPRFLENIVTGDVEEEEAEFGATGTFPNGTVISLGTSYEIHAQRNHDAYSLYYEIGFWIITMYLIPLPTIAILNFQIWRKIRTANSNRSTMNGSSSHTSAGTISLTKMLLTVVLVFFITNSLNCALVMFALHQWGMPNTLSEQITNFTLVINSSVNFIIYCGLGAQFRRQFKLMISSWFCSSAWENANTSVTT